MRILIADRDSESLVAAGNYLSTRRMEGIFASDYEQAMQGLCAVDGAIIGWALPSANVRDTYLGEKAITEMLYFDALSRPEDYTPLHNAMRADPADQPSGILLARYSEISGVPFILVTNCREELALPLERFAERRGRYAAGIGWRTVRPVTKEEKATPEFWRRAVEELEKEFRR